MNVNFKPLQDRILVESIEQDDITKNGIIIPDTAKEKPIKGIVIEVGDGIRDKNGNFLNTEVKKGDKIMFTKWCGNEIKLNGKKYLLMKESEILGKIL